MTQSDETRGNELPQWLTLTEAGFVTNRPTSALLENSLISRRSLGTAPDGSKIVLLRTRDLERLGLLPPGYVLVRSTADIRQRRRDRTQLEGTWVAGVPHRRPGTTGLVT